ncbi:transglutaminase family protein [Isoptericola aurantiacus]|uniref:transglutaminase family protein n=1 Tax=Isoptericola aurantiacus TaxID=3377839 RepID=UPI00383B4CC8
MIPLHAGPTARLVATSTLVAVAVGASMLALTALVLPGPWVRTGLAGIALVTVATAVTRGLVESRRRRRGDGATGGSALPTVAGGLAAAWFVLSRYGAPTSEPTLLVGPAHVARVVERLGDAGEIIRSEVAPVPGTLPITLLAVGGTLAVLLLADALAGGLRWPATVGLPLLALWAPPLVLVGEVPRGVFVVVVAALLLLLTMPDAPRAPGAERPPPTVRRAEQVRTLATTSIAVVVALGAGLVASASGALPGYAGAWYQAFTTSGDSIQLAEDLDVLNSLTERSDEVVLTYVGPEEDVGPLRTYTASAFDGRRWQRGDERSGEPFSEEDLLWPDDTGRTSLGDRQDVSFTIGSLRDDQLPVPVEPRRVQVEGTWGYDAVRDEVVGDRTDEGDRYVVGVRERSLDVEVLRAAGPGTAVDAYLDVPGTDHADDVAALAAEVAADAPTAYDQAVALQDWLRDPSTFTYSTQLPRGGTGDPVWDFLQHRTGYCVQFATTMAVMARTLGIPSRLGVGFLPGDTVEASDGSPIWRVTGQDSHAWPELYFEGLGWVRFEPTPAVQTGAAPEYTTEQSSGSATSAPQPQEVPTAAAPVPEDAGAPGADESEPAVAVSTSSDDDPLWPWAVGGAVLLVLVATAVVLVLRRRRDDGPLDPERAWQQVVSALERDGVRLPPRTTPHTAPEIVTEAVTAARGSAPSPEVRAGLRTLADALEHARYAAPDEPAGDEVDLAEVADVVTRGLAENR